MPTISISYRRADSDAITGRIFDRLVNHYGKESVFRDIDNIPLGADFREHIENKLGESDVILVIIGPRWIGGRGAEGRLANPVDPVRIEVELALRRKVPVIPILVGNAAMPKIEQLPDTMKDLAYRNGQRIDAGQDFEMHTDRLMRAIDQLVGHITRTALDEAAAPAATGPEPTLPPPAQAAAQPEPTRVPPPVFSPPVIEPTAPSPPASFAPPPEPQPAQTAAPYAPYSTRAIWWSTGIVLALCLLDGLGSYLDSSGITVGFFLLKSVIVTGVACIFGALIAASPTMKGKWRWLGVMAAVVICISYGADLLYRAPAGSDTPYLVGVIIGRLILGVPVGLLAGWLAGMFAPPLVAHGRIVWSRAGSGPRLIISGALTSAAFELLVLYTAVSEGFVESAATYLGMVAVWLVLGFVLGVFGRLVFAAFAAASRRTRGTSPG